MSDNRTLTVHANPEKGMMRDARSIGTGRARMVGMRWDSALHAFVKTDAPSTIPFDEAYKKAVQQGALVPADADTAALCEVPWTEPLKKQS